jgi:hypothetical protein
MGKVQLTEEDVIKKAFTNLMENAEHDRYWSILVNAFTSFAMTMELLYDHEDGSSIPFQETLDKFIKDVTSSEKYGSENSSLVKLLKEIGEANE